MRRNRILRYVVIFMLFISSVGCGALQRKFVRKKKKDEAPAPVITTFDYSKELRVDELYKKHYLFWKTWQMELIDRMDAGPKKRISCYDSAMTHLLEMEDYLKEPKASELKIAIKEIEDIGAGVKNKRLSNNERYRIIKSLERTLRQIEKEFSYSDVKDFLELKK